MALAVTVVVRKKMAARPEPPVGITYRLDGGERPSCAKINLRQRTGVSTRTTAPENKCRAAAESGALVTATLMEELPARRHPCSIFRAFMTERDESSIAACSACKSSVREITGKSRTKAQARARIPRVLPWPRSEGVPLNPSGRQKKKAPMATISQSVFSTTSMSCIESTMTD